MRYPAHFDTILWIVEVLIKSSAAIGIAALVASRLRKRFPSASHLAWVLGFAAAVALPVFSAVSPDLAIYRIDSSLFSALKPQTTDTAVTPASQSNGVQTTPVQPTTTQAPFGGAIGTKLLNNGDWPLWLALGAGIWVLGALAFLVRVLVGLHCLRVVRKYGTRPIESDALADRIDHLSSSAKVSRGWDLRIGATPELLLPMTWGAVRPTVVLPLGAEEWPDMQFEAVMLHELAHVRRFDFASQTFAQLVCALYWFNPIVWCGARAMRSDAELAADEAVLRTGLKPSDYASELLKLASRLGGRKQAFAYVGTPAMNNSKIETRLLSVLSYPGDRRGMSSIQVLALCAVALAAIPAFAGLHARIQDPTSPTSAPRNEQDEAIWRLKQTALATIMYASDYDDQLPYVQRTSSAVAVLMPYAKSHMIFESPSKGGQFLFNMNLAGVSLSNITEPASTPLWMNVVPKSQSPMVVAFADGHVKATPLKTVKEAAARKFRRIEGMKPLPADYPPKS
ncbi:MAG: M56 family metallopeptidase [Fimbriimonas sp.]|nr:M56 family metallopeptidase [Fimbriimonas sp.]